MYIRAQSVKQIFISKLERFAKKIQSSACAFTMDLYCCITHLLAIMAGKLACISVCLMVSSAMK